MKAISKAISIGSLVLLFTVAAREVWAGSVTYAPLATSVPMSSEGLMVMAGLLLAAGIWILIKSKRGIGIALMIAGLAIGSYPVTVNAVAINNQDIYLNNPQGGTASFDEMQGGYVIVHNISGVTQKITDITPKSVSTSDQCTIGMTLKDGETCRLFYK